jgi:phosphate transport system ATP-binding protein
MVDECTNNAEPKVVFSHFSVWFGGIQALQDIQLEAFRGQRLALLGAAGSGKSTLLRSLNRRNDLTPGYRHQGSIRLDNQDIFNPKLDTATLRRRIGLVSTPAAILPGSIFDNVAIALRMAGEQNKQRIYEKVQAGLTQAHVWDRVKDQLQRPASNLTTSVILQLSLARTLVLEPEVLLLDEPGAGLDNLAVTMLEDVLEDLKETNAILIATNDLKQAARASDRTAFLHRGELVESGPTRQLFTQPHSEITFNFITERF